MENKDLLTAAKLFLVAFGPEGLGEEWTIASSRKNIEDFFNSNFCFAVKERDELVGVIMGQAQYFEKGAELFIGPFVVRKEQRGKGLGRLLFARVEKEARKKGLVGVRLMANQKLPSFAWYGKMGIKPSGWEEMHKLF